MYDLYLVDDDILIRNNLTMLLGGFAPRIRVAGTAQNGSEALHYLEETPLLPHILITDIKMPVMDGLTLVKKVSERYPDMVLIVLSNYDEFEYVRTALKYGVTDYWLKHELSEAMLRPALEKAIRHIPGSSVNDTKERGMELHPQLQEVFFTELLTGYPFSDEKLRMNEQLFGFPLLNASLLPVILQLGGLRQQSFDETLRSSVVLSLNIRNLILDLISRQTIGGTVISLSPKKYCILFSAPAYMDARHLYRSVRELLLLIEDHIRKYLNMEVVFTVGNAPVRCRQLADAYRETEALSQNGPFFRQADPSPASYAPAPSGTVSAISQPGTAPLSGLPYGWETELGAALRATDKSAVFSCLDKIFDDIARSRPDRKSCQLIFSDLHKILTLTCKINHVSYEGISPSSLRLDQIFSEVYDFDSIRRQFYESFREVADYLHKPREVAKSAYVSQAMAILGERYCEDISLQEIADEIGISASYLSTLFKSETSMSFTQYVNTLRIRKARVMLQETALSIEEIASRCGYHNYDYFFKVFKKITGKTPSSYVRQ